MMTHAITSVDRRSLQRLGTEGFEQGFYNVRLLICLSSDCYSVYFCLISSANSLASAPEDGATGLGAVCVSAEGTVALEERSSLAAHANGLAFSCCGSPSNEH